MKVLRLGVLTLLFCCGCSNWSSEPESAAPVVERIGDRFSRPWLLIESKSRRGTLFKADGTSSMLKELSFGSGGIDLKRRQGDQVTPLGVFRVTAIRPSKKYGTFIEISYPTRRDADRGYKEGIIDARTWQRIVKASREGRRPPMMTPLGGHIGIHGEPLGGPSLTGVLDYTNGWVGVSEAEMTVLEDVLKIGSVVHITENP